MNAFNRITRQRGQWSAARQAFNLGISLQDALCGFFGPAGLKHYRGE